MTSKQRPRTQPVRTLQALLLTAGVVATLAGTRMLAAQNPATPAIETTTMESTLTTDSAAALPDSDRADSPLSLQPIPQAVQPRLNPVARTRSSR